MLTLFAIPWLLRKMQWWLLASAAACDVEEIQTRTDNTTNFRLRLYDPFATHLLAV
jgi:hypothetical protein